MDNFSCHKYTTNPPPFPEEKSSPKHKDCQIFNEMKVFAYIYWCSISSNRKKVLLHVYPTYTTSCRGYNVFDPSVSQFVSSGFFCQRSYSETSQQNLKLYSYKEYTV